MFTSLFKYKFTMHKSNEVLVYATMWMNPENMLSENFQRLDNYTN